MHAARSLGVEEGLKKASHTSTGHNCHNHSEAPGPCWQCPADSTDWDVGRYRP